jgi:hypothetical protein
VLAIAGILEEGYFVCSHINAVRSTAICLHTLSHVFVWFSDLRGLHQHDECGSAEAAANGTDASFVTSRFF